MSRAAASWIAILVWATACNVDHPPIPGPEGGAKPIMVGSADAVTAASAATSGGAGGIGGAGGAGGS